MSVKSALTLLGPRRILTHASPNLPISAGVDNLQIGSVSGHPGTLKALASNQSVMDCPEVNLPLPILSGRPPKLLVFEGSNLENDGVK